VHTISQLFAYFAEADLRRWSSMVGQSVTHTDFGRGSVVEVKQREKYTPIIEICFPDCGVSHKFNSDSFKNDWFADLEIPSALLENFSAWRTKWEADRAIAREREQSFAKGKAAFESLAARYKIPVGKVITREGPTFLAEIILTIDEGSQLTDDQLRSLESASDCANVTATYLYRQYRRSADPWQLVRACKYLRMAGQPENAVKISAKINEGFISDTKAHSALHTTVGGAYKDLNDIVRAKQCANQAIALAPQSYHPHNLMGAILYGEGDAEKGNEHFEKAVALGSSSRAQDAEIRKVLEKATPENRNAIVEFLVTKDAARYGWAKVFAD